MKKILNITIALLAVLGLAQAVQAQGQNSYVHTTLTNAIDAKTTTFQVGSTTSLAPANNPDQTVGNVTNNVKQLILIGSELMEVSGVVGSTTVIVDIRGYAGTLQIAHPASDDIWAGPPSFFPVADKLGSCNTANERILPVFSINRASKQVRLYNCINNQWRPQTMPSDTFKSGAYGTCDFGAGILLTQAGVSSAVAASTTENLAEVFVPFSFFATGAGLVTGTTPDAATTRVLTLRNMDGRLIANTATAGTAASATGSAEQKINFVTQALISGPASYLVGYSASGADADGVNLLTTAAPAQGVTGQITGLTYGTVPVSVTPPTAFNTATGAAVCIF